ncbi:F0F1 ATP synthase subunit B [Roseibacterium sp. SDUM158016]|jgi:F-type H+-transporting ATPase subunit b|uniref:F0F1 ATP synthase subunit B n=1 Tax=Roseicyclus sediminis TaxID=2980997 RepID=UPI0021D1FDEB|nr:F0F1 ATP synthase subunit B [Roseibacterium sp. SDUM158016]MCU4651283.1 F0F1 ATP synthase subunit B [Roseibacterium sp. SDUM158016]
MRAVIVLTAAIAAALPATAAEPGYAPGYDFTSLFNTDFVVLIGFILFVSILFYFNVPALLGGMLDKRAEGIKSELDEARALREEAQTLLASYERKQREVAEQSERIVNQARADAEAAAEAAKAELERSIARRLVAAEDQIASAEAKAVRAIRDRAVEVAVGAAGELIASRMAAADANALIDSSIEQVQARLN